MLQSSANPPAGPTPRRLEDVDARIRAGVDLELDGGELPGTPSTVVDLSGLRGSLAAIPGAAGGRRDSAGRESPAASCLRYRDSEMTDLPPDYFTKPVSEVDPEIAEVLEDELRRQETTLEMIASENFVPQAVLDCQGSVLTNKYAEGYPGKRYYGGCEHVDVAEKLAIERAKELFGAEHANVQPHAGRPGQRRRLPRAAAAGRHASWA